MTHALLLVRPVQYDTLESMAGQSAVPLGPAPFFRVGAAFSGKIPIVIGDSPSSCTQGLLISSRTMRHPLLQYMDVVLVSGFCTSLLSVTKYIQCLFAPQSFSFPVIFSSACQDSLVRRSDPRMDHRSTPYEMSSRKNITPSTNLADYAKRHLCIHVGTAESHEVRQGQSR